jgi:dephospho-CoA kinase
MLIIGLTGGIGTGKSEVARILSELGAKVIEADLLGHDAYRPSSQVWREVVAAFGEEILKQQSGEIDRKRLGAIVFNDPEAMDRLNSIMWPHIAERVHEEIDQCRLEETKVVVVEAALLIEAGWDSMVDEIWVTWSPQEAVVKRLGQGEDLGGRSLSEEEVLRRIGSQMSFDERAARAQAIVRNEGNKYRLRQEVQLLWGDRVKGRVE